MRSSKAALFFVTIFLLAQTQGWAALREEKRDKNGDGKIDQWLRYNSKGKLVQKAADTNGDGKPDQFQTFPRGSRDLAIKEYDRNFDGKIDKRAWTQWDPAKTIPSVNNGRMSRIPNPSYTTIEREEDNDFDGVIDAGYRKKEKGKKSSEVFLKIGQPLDPKVSAFNENQESAKSNLPTPPDSSPGNSKINRLNEQHGY